MRKTRWTALCLIFILLAGLMPWSPAWAAPSGGLALEAEERSSAALPRSQGYIVKLRSDVIMPFGLDGEEGGLGLGMYLVDSAEDVQALIRAGMVEFAEPNYVRYLFSGGLVNDEYYVANYQWNLDFMKMGALWNMGLTGDGVKVAVVDTGLSLPHVDLPGSRMLTGYNAVDGNSDTADVDVHGTFVSGVIAAEADNFYGVAGVAYGASIIPCMVFRDVLGSDGHWTIGAFSSDIVKAINWATDHGADVINLSLGSPSSDIATQTAVDNAVSKGVIVVAAAGNDGNATMNYPAGCSNVIGVGAVGEVLDMDAQTYYVGVKDRWAQYSNYNGSVFVSAPGTEAYGPAVKRNANGTYTSVWGTLSGTSFASPCVAALAALAKEYDKSIDTYQFQNLLMLTADDRGPSGWDAKYGYGIVNAANMAAALPRRSISYELNYETDSAAWLAGLREDQKSFCTYQSESVTLPVPVREDYTFAGWHRNADLSGLPETAIALPALRDSVTYYAKWLNDNSALSSVVYTLDGTDHDCPWGEGDDYRLYLPYGTDLTGGVLRVEAASPTTEVTVTRDDADPGVWTVRATPESGHAKDYTVVIDVSNHAPALARSDRETATVCPSSLDTRTPAETYAADLTGWFDDPDTPSLTYRIDNVEVDGVPAALPEVPALNLVGSALTYSPTVPESGRTLTFSVTAWDGRFTSPPVDVALTVGPVPMSQPVLTPASGVFNTRDGETDHVPVCIGYEPYDNTLYAVTADAALLTADADYLLDDEEKTVTLTLDFLQGLSAGVHELTLHFSRGPGEARAAAFPLTVVVPHEHSWSASWTAGESHHWHPCEGEGECTAADDSEKDGYAPHDFTAPATCVSPKTCPVCGATEGEALGHDWQAATCTTPKTCARCDATEGEALGHDWQAATCVSPKTCARCDAVDGEALGHDWQGATCTTPKTCARCDATEGEALGHDWQGATCVSPKTCARCDAVDGEALGHDWQAATCTTPKTCARCDTTEGEALGHDWQGATCTAPKTCARCDATQGEALGHDWQGATCLTPKTCARCDATEGEALGHDWQAADCTTPKTCARCDTVDGEALGHDWQAATCTTPKTCARCDATQGEALGHDWQGATCTTPKTCARCDATEGEALGHDWQGATCTTPKTCARCDATEGEALGHDWQAATCLTPKTCARCDAVEGEALGHAFADAWTTDANHHWHAAVCGHADQETGRATHVYDSDRDADCNVCGYTRAITPAPAPSKPSGGGGGGSVRPPVREPDPAPSAPVLTAREDGPAELVIREARPLTQAERQAVAEASGRGKDAVVTLPGLRVKVPGGTVGSAEQVEGLLADVSRAKAGNVVVRTDEQGGRQVVPLSLVTDGHAAYVADRPGRYALEENPVEFDDISDHWARQSIGFSAARELTRGMTPGHFEPERSASRAMVFTLLARMEGAELPDPRYNWYDGAVTWAMAQGLSDGTRPEAQVKREELATLLWRWAGRPRPQGGLSGFADADAVSPYALQPLAWAVEAGILSGRPDATIDPHTGATRAETAVMLERLITYLVEAQAD